MIRLGGVSRAILFAACSGLTGCTPFVQVMNTDKVPQEERTRAANIRVHLLENTQARPEVAKVMADVDSYSCQFMPSDPPASKANALLQLQIKAARAGANGLLDVSFDSAGFDLGTNCWSRVHAHGTAAVLAGGG